MKNLKILLIFSSCVLLAGCFEKKEAQQKTEDISKTTKTSDVKTEKKEKKEVKSLEIKSLSGCDNIKDANEKKNCVDDYYKYVALSQSDSNLCNKISDTDKKEACRKEYLSRTSLGNDECEDMLGQACTNVQTINEAFVKDDISVCNEISDDAVKITCIQDYLKKNQNKSGICDNLKDVKFKKSCQDEVSYLSAISQKDQVKCNKISDPIRKNACVSSISSTKKDTANNDCFKLSDAKAKETCLSKQALSNAISSNNPSLCEILDDKSVRQFCEDSYYFTMATKKKNQNFCQKISNINLKNSCDAIFN